MRIEIKFEQSDVQGIRVRELAEYLTQRGWVELPSNRERTRYFEYPKRLDVEGKPLRYYIPISEKYDDYWHRVIDFLNAQAHFQKVSPKQIYDEILVASALVKVPASSPQKPRRPNPTPAQPVLPDSF